MLAPLLIASIGLRDPAFIAAPLLLLAVAAAVRPPGGRLAALALVPLAAACGLLPLVKATFGTEAVVLAALAAAVLALGGRRWLAALLPCVFVAALLGGWRLAGQPMGALQTYLGTVRLLIAGYTEGGALAGPPSEILAFVAAAALLLVLLGRTWRRRDRAVGAVLMLGVAFTLFVAFKAGFVRHDVHAMIALGTLALLPLLLVRELSAPALALAVPVSLAALGFVGADHAADDALSPAQGVQRLVQAARGGGERWADPGALDRRFAADLAAMRAAAPLPQVAGPSDIYSTGQSVLLANRLAWSPRPALQSVTAMSATLARADRDHLLAAVQNVFLRVENDDNRFRALEDGLSWPALLSAYTLRGFDARQDLLRLQRRAGAVAAEPDAEAFFAGRFAVGAAVPLPMLAAAPPGLIWAKLDVRPTLLGRLAALLFRPPILALTLADADGRGESFRLLSSLAGAGFVLAPVVRDTTGFAMLLLPERAAPRYRPATLMLSGSSGTRLLWDRTFGLTLHMLNIPPQPPARQLVLAPLGAPPPPLAAAAEAGTAPACALDAVDDRAPRAAPLAVGGSLRVRGWAAVPGGRGAATDTLFIRLAAADGHAVFAATRPVARPDVARHFGRAELVDPGFEAAIDLGDLAGPATLAIDVLRDGQRWTCAVQQRLLIETLEMSAQPGVGAAAMP